MLAETVQRLEAKIERLLNDFGVLRSENVGLRTECDRLLREREALREEIDRILARLDAIEIETS